VVPKLLLKVLDRHFNSRLFKNEKTVRKNKGMLKNVAKIKTYAEYAPLI